MLQMKFVLFAAVALMAVGSTVAIIGGTDVFRGRFPYFALIKSYQMKAPVISLYNSKKCSRMCIETCRFSLFSV